MSNELKLFNHDMFGEIGILIKDDKEYFPATEVAEKLGYKNKSDAINKHCKKEGIIAISQNTTEGNTYQKKFINEGNLYRLIVKSRLSEAEKFESWIFEEVLPTIRKTGGYISNADLMVNTYFGSLPSDNKAIIKGLFLNIEEQQKELTKKNQIIEEQKPLVTFAEKCLASNDSILVRELSKLAQDEGLKNVGEKNLYKKLRSWGLILKDKNEPSQRAMDKEYFEVIQRPIQTPYGEKLTRTTKVTPKGQVYIIERLMKEQKDHSQENAS